jgi:hypothetical protein
MPDSRKDVRSLESITRATETALRFVEREAVFRDVIMGVLSAGPGRIDNPAYCLAAQLAGVRDFLAAPPENGRPALRRIEIRVVDPRAWAALAEGRLAAGDVLTSELTRVLVRVADGYGRWEEYAVSVPHDATVDDVLCAYGIADERVEVTARPLPKRDRGDAREVPVFPGMVIEVQPLT